MHPSPGHPHLTFRAGQLLVHDWPAGLALPFGMQHRGSGAAAGPARLRWRVRQALDHARIAYRDEITRARAEFLPRHRSHDRPAGTAVGTAAGTVPGTLTATRQAGCRGILAGLADTARTAVVESLVHTLRQPALAITVDSGAEHRWRRSLLAVGLADACAVLTFAAASRDMHWLGARYELLVVDSPEFMTTTMLERVLDSSAALARIGFTGRADWRRLSTWASGLGPLIAFADELQTPRCQEIRVPMPAGESERYAAAWGTFLATFDRFAAARPDAGFGTFIAQARRDPLQRPALRAWHEALRLAAWHDHKAAVITELLERHRHQRVLLFTPDRSSAYALASRHLIPAITAEIPRAERINMLDAFARGSLRALAGPRLLDVGVDERCADVAILVGGGYGRDQRSARCRRVARDGIVYELVSHDTLEVGRAHRWRGTPADATAVVHRG